jgi:ATP-dependent 26S proteasome regulatory subunit
VFSRSPLSPLLQSSPQGVRQPWKGILLYGPPGTGKTELAKGIAGESGAAFLLLTPSTLLSKFMGESEKMMSRIFAYAKHLAEEHQAAIIFLDEVDSLTTSRGSDGDSQPGMRRLLAELLLQFNSLNSKHRVVVIAATNRIEDLDPALLRRFERRIEVNHKTRGCWTIKAHSSIQSLLKMCDSLVYSRLTFWRCRLVFLVRRTGPSLCASRWRARPWTPA